MFLHCTRRARTLSERTLSATCAHSRRSYSSHSNGDRTLSSFCCGCLRVGKRVRLTCSAVWRACLLSRCCIQSPSCESRRWCATAALHCVCDVPRSVQREFGLLGASSLSSNAIASSAQIVQVCLVFVVVETDTRRTWHGRSACMCSLSSCPASVGSLSVARPKSALVLQSILSRATAAPQDHARLE